MPGEGQSVVRTHLSMVGEVCVREPEKKARGRLETRFPLLICQVAMNIAPCSNTIPPLTVREVSSLQRTGRRVLSQEARKESVLPSPFQRLGEPHLGFPAPALAFLPPLLLCCSSPISFPPLTLLPPYKDRWGYIRPSPVIQNSLPLP